MMHPTRTTFPDIPTYSAICDDIVTYVITNGTRTVLAILVGVAVLVFGTDGSDGGDPSQGVVVLSIAAGAIVWYITRPQKSGADKPK